MSQTECHFYFTAFTAFTAVSSQRFVLTACNKLSQCALDAVTGWWCTHLYTSEWKTDTLEHKLNT